jgi:tetratricopeptide (TPR) repeat protein
MSTIRDLTQWRRAMMSIYRTVIFVLLACVLVAPALVAAHEDAAGKPKAEKFGRVFFKTSCTPAAQKQFDRALAMLHSFYFPETVKAFTAIPETDPGCAIAYWGIAISQRPNPLVGPFDAATLKRGLDAIEKGEAIGAKTEQERDWLAALKEFYKDYDKVDQDTRTLNYEKAMEALVKKYPKDIEAKIFYALALNESFDHKSMDTLLKAIAILKPIDKKYPDHPGVTHYLIHSYDFAPIAKKGVPAANKYAKVAPSAPHAQHMPSHIYSMVGMWEQSIRSNQQAVEISRQIGAKNWPGTGKIFPQATHAWDFMAYAYLQLGQDQHAKEIMNEMKTAQMGFYPNVATYTAMTAVPARYYLERQDWAGAAKLEPLNTPYPAADAITYFARAIGGARSGDFAAARQDVDKLTALRAALDKANQSYWAGQVEVQILGAQAWLAQGQGNRDEALKFMRAAADLEDGSEKHVAMENRLYPMRELLGDLLMEQGNSALALTEYETSMRNAPARLRGFYGAAKAAEATGDNRKATAYLRSLARLTRNADGDRAELREIKQHLASR